MADTISQVLATFAVIAVVCVAIAVVGLALLLKSIRKLHVPKDIGFFATMRLIPFSLVVLLDLLDLGLDVFAAPIAWIFLDRMGLPNLRNKATIEALIPFSGPIPTFTLSWLAVRLFGLGEAELRQIDQAASAFRRRQGTIIDVDAVGARPTTPRGVPAITDLDEPEVSRYNSVR